MALAMRVLYLSAAGEIGGGNQSLLTVWPALGQRGVGIHAAIPGEGAMVAACRDLQIPVDVMSYPQPSWRRPRVAWVAYQAWLALLRRTRADLVHANSLEGARSVALAAQRLQKPVVCHVRFPPDASTARWAFRGLPKPALFLFNSHALFEQAGPELIRACPRTPQRVIYNAIDLAAFRGGPARRSTVPRIGIVANLSPIKGHADFLSMAESLVGRRLCEFWIVGADIARVGYDRELEEDVRRRGLTGAVKFLGFRSDVADVMADLDIVVSCSHYESFGRTLVEAMACERPVVATAVGGVPEIVLDGVTGLLVPSKNPAALSAAVVRLLDDPAFAARLGRAGRQRAEALFGIPACADQLYEAYAQLAARRQVLQPCA